MAALFGLLFFVTLIAFPVLWWKKRKARISEGKESDTYKKFSSIKRVTGIVCIVSFVIAGALAPAPEKKEPAPQPKQETQEVQQPASSNEQSQPKEEEKKNDRPTAEEARANLPICPLAGLGDTKDFFRRSYPGQEKGGMWNVKDGAMLAIDDGTHIINLTVTGQTPGDMNRLSDDTVADNMPSDKTLLEDRGSAKDGPGDRWISVYHSDSLAQRVPSCEGKFIIIQRIYPSGQRVFVIATGDNP